MTGGTGCPTGCLGTSGWQGLQQGQVGAPGEVREEADQAVQECVCVHRPPVHFPHGGGRQDVREVPSDWSEQCCSPDTFLQSDCWGADNTPLDNFRVPHGQHVLYVSHIIGYILVGRHL